MWRAGVFAVALQAAASPAGLTLEIRVFKGSEEVTAETRIAVHTAGDRSAPVARIDPGARRTGVVVPAGLYDAQAVHERRGRVLEIQWAQRLVVMAYPDEGGHHLEVINFDEGFGALQVRCADGREPPSGLALYATGDRTAPIAPVAGDGYALFVVPAGPYDLRVPQGRTVTWQTGIDVPADRTRLRLVP